MSLNDAARRIRGFLEASSREEAEEEGNRRVYAYLVDLLDGIYYDDVNSANGRCIGGLGVSAVAAEFPLVQLFNPANSGIDTIVEKIIITSSTTQTIELRAATTALEAEVTTQDGRRDFRSSTGNTCALRSGTEAVASGVIRGAFRLLANTPFTLEPDICLGPQNGIHMEGATVNTDLTVMFFWRERSPSRRQRG